MTATDRRRRTAFPDLAVSFAQWRNRLVGSRRFQRWAASFPLTQGFARRDGERLFDLMAGFVYSQVLQACIELGVLQRLRNGPLHPAEIATQIALTEDRTTTLCLGAAALDLLERRRDGKFQLGRLGAAVLGVPGLEAMILHHRIFYRDLSDPVALLRGESDTELAHFWPYVFGATAEIEGAAATAYSDLMAGSQALVAEEILRSVRLDGVSRLMDVGGGTGALLTAVAAGYPNMRLTLFDLPAVTAAAAARLAGGGLAARIDLVGGSFRTDSLPWGADAISLVRVLYDHDDQTVAGLLARSRAALPAGGRLLIAEPMSGGARPSRFGDGYFALYTMAMRTGHVRSPKRIAELLRGAGFDHVKSPRTLRPFVTSIVTARKAP